MGRRGAQGSGIRCARIQRSRSRVNRSRTAGTGQSRLGREPETDRPLESSFIEPIHTENAVFVFSRCVAALISEMSLEYNIAGPADDEDYAQAEYLAEMLMVSLPSIKCNLIPILPDNWSDFVTEKCGFLGCKQRAPLIWMTSGIVVGGLPDWNAECEKKYGLRVTGVEFSTWPKVAAENHAAAKKKAANIRDPLVGSKEEKGVECGLAISEELQSGNLRYRALRESAANSASGSDGRGEAAAASSTGGAVVHEALTGLPRPAGLAEPAATVLELTPLPAPAHVLLGCPEEALFVVPCTPVGIEELVQGNAEFGCIRHKTKLVLLLGGPTAEMATYVQAAKDAKLARDSPLSTGQRAVFEAMLPALARVLAVAPPRCTAREVEALCLDEWVRESTDELLRQSAVLAELNAREAIHIERASFDADGTMSLL